MDNREDVLVQSLISEADSILRRYRQDYRKLSWREKVLALVALSRTVKLLAVNSDPRAARVSARERIRLYLIAHVETVIDAAELEVVSGISDYGRRIRELRVEDGYRIITGNSNDPDSQVQLKPDEYLLLRPDPDTEAARRWSLANRIRKEVTGGSRARILRYLQENVGQVVTTEELAYVGKASEFGRRLRELRTEEGYSIATRFTGRPDLGMGEYVLESAERIAEPHDRNIPIEVGKGVYRRDNNTCRLCGWEREQWRRDDPRILELHHVREHAEGGQNSPDNLLVLCSRCHDDLHAGRRTLPPDIVPPDE